MGSEIADGVTIREVVPEQLSSRELASFAALMTDLAQEISPSDGPVSPGWVLARYYSQSTLFPKRFVIAEKDEAIVGLAHLEFERTGQNEDTVFLEIEVAPDQRRGGIGSALLAHALTIADQEAVTNVVTWGLHSEETQAFWSQHKAELAYTESMSRLALADIDEAQLTDWVARAQPARDAGYRLVSWRGACPEEHLDAFVGALAGMADAPLDDLDVAPESHTHGSVRQHEARWLGVDSEPWVMLITAPDGSPAAMTEIIVHAHRAEEIWQQGTTTLAAERNQGLGRWIKAEMLMQVRAEQISAIHILTGNADSNESMLNINGAMGFVHYAPFACHQATVATLGSSAAR